MKKIDFILSVGEEAAALSPVEYIILGDSANDAKTPEDLQILATERYEGFIQRVGELEPNVTKFGFQPDLFFLTRQVNLLDL